MTYVIISAIMNSLDDADRLYAHVKATVSPDRISITNGTKVIAEDTPQNAGMIAEAFASFLADTNQ